MTQIDETNLAVRPLCWILLLVGIPGCGSPPAAIDEAVERATERVSQAQEKATIGATAQVLETQCELVFQARVDTGASYCSVHYEEVVIEDEAEEMTDNIGKPIRVKLQNEQDEESWIETEIEDCLVVKTSEKREQRYRVPLRLRINDLEKEVLVTLNNRSHMQYPMLVGRNFLQGEFLVDVDWDEH